jgi:general secretion pathway protein N
MIKIKVGGLAVAILALSPFASIAQSPPASPQIHSFALPPLEELRATRERPLFSPNRKPDAEVATRTEEPVIEESPAAVPFELTGVVMGAKRAVAILRNRETMETVHLHQGETAETWSVEEIAQRHIVLSSEGKQVRLQLFDPKPEGAAGSPAQLPNPHQVDPPRPRRNPAALAPPRRGSDRPSRPRRAQ